MDVGTQWRRRVGGKHFIRTGREGQAKGEKSGIGSKQ